MHSLDGVIIHSHGCRLMGTFWRADTHGKHPTVLLLHGIPGVEKNTDLAYALREAGWNCLTFHYRGCWGSEGNYSLPGIVDDIMAAIDYLSDHPNVDRDRLAGVGLSLGGWGVIAAAARDAQARLHAVVSMNPLVDPKAQPLDDNTFAEFASMLNGIAPQQVKEQYFSLTPANHLAPQLAGRPVLLLTGDADELFPPDHIQPLAAAMPFAKWHRIPHANHVFSDHRRIMVQTVIDWLTLTFLLSHPHTSTLSHSHTLTLPHSHTPTLSSSLSLRPLAETDHPRVLAVLSDWWGGRDLSPLLPRLYFQHFNDASLIVEKDGELIAFLIGFMSQSEPGLAYIHLVGVHPEQRQSGVGRLLYERFFALARARGAREVHAITAPVNIGSQTYHRRMGFEVSEAIQDYDGPGDDRMTLKRQL